MLGPLLVLSQTAIVPYPGGCKLGARPIDLHQMALERLGATVDFDQQYVFARRNSANLIGARIVIPLKSNGAAECAILASCLAIGTTVIEEAHVTPELLDFIRFLNSMGAKVTVNSSRVTVRGVEQLHGTNYRIMSDVVEGVTFALISTLTEGNILISDFPIKEAFPILQKLYFLGVNVKIENENLAIAPAEKPLSGFKIAAGAYPQIYSDMQPLLSVFGLKCNGVSYVSDERWPQRFTHVEPLNEMGANIKRERNSIEIHGMQNLHGTTVVANDIRCGMAILMAALIAQGPTVIKCADQIERGYENIVKKLQSIGILIDKHVCSEPFTATSSMSI